MLHVVAGVIVRENRILCCRKGHTNHEETSYKFEFPGGKIKHGESPEIALKRELLEELGIEINLIKSLESQIYSYPNLTVCIEFYLCEISQYEPIATEHIELIWCTQENIQSLEWLAADLPLVDRIHTKGIESLFS
ncbi:MAG: (deoxy)nucleoside triphosphate pyrophosphohydrolase [Cryomorphaceae bacterium]|nr:(deoxy)nucleoside triphosphate pyrophosphohydrolase [Cryomorphaceae bacterium]